MRATAKFRDSTRVAPLVLRSDFLTFLESNRSSPKQWKKANALSNSAGSGMLAHLNDTEVGL